MYKRNYKPLPSGIYSEYARLAHHSKIHHMNGLKKKNHMILSREKSFDKIQDTFVMKILSKLEIEGNFLSLVKNIYRKLPLTSLNLKLSHY